VAAGGAAWYNSRGAGHALRDFTLLGDSSMAKPHRGLKKANHGARPANSKARKMKRKHIRT
jgi:hypothetical protein